MSVRRRCRIPEIAVLASICAALGVASSARADWTGPTELVGATWGAGPDQLGLGAGDVAEYDVFPSRVLVDADGTLVIPDPANDRIVVRRPDGSPRAAFGPSGLGNVERQEWPNEVFLVGGSIVTKARLVLQRYDLDGALLAGADKVDGVLAGISAQGRIVVRSAAASPSWTLFRDDLVADQVVASEPPLRGAFEIVDERRREPDPGGAGTRDVSLTTIRFPGAAVTLRDFRFGIDDVLRDGQGRIYVVTSDVDPAHTHTVHYVDGGPSSTVAVPHIVVLELAGDGSIAGRLDLPPDTWAPVVTANPGDMTEPQPTGTVGGVTLDAQGHVYHWIRDGQRYRILRWDRR